MTRPVTCPMRVPVAGGTACRALASVDMSQRAAPDIARFALAPPLVFGRIRAHLPAAAFEADKILFNSNFSLYRNTAKTAGWYRHEVGKVSYRDAMTNPAAMHFDERAGIYYIVEGPRRARLAPGCDL
jgi:hypothetical protein